MALSAAASCLLCEPPADWRAFAAMLLQSLVKLITISCCGLQATAPEKDAHVVRKVSLEDLAAVLELLAVSAAWSLPELEATLQQSHTLALLATTGPISVGCILAWLLDDELQILDVVVHPTHRRQGIGKALLKVLLNQAQERGCALATLEVSKDNAAAVQLYQQLGFQQVHLRKSYYRDGSDALLMNKCV
ncbi:hypothetical protein WJX77_005309 [Trebouxia sp. C0004]